MKGSARVTRIERHHIDTAEVVDKIGDYQQWLAQDRKLTHVSPTAIKALAQHAHLYASCASITDPDADSPEVLDALVIGTEARTALFIIASGQPDSTVEFSIGDITIEGPADAHWDRTRADWRAAFCGAVLTRRKDLTDLLASIDDRVLTVHGVTYQPYAKPWTDALKAVWTEDLVAAADNLSTALETVTGVDDSWSHHIAAPAMVVLADIVENNPGQLAIDLAIALEDHKTYWSSPQRRNDPDGFLSCELLAMCALAYDYGMPITVESDYIPRHLITGDWIAEA